MNRPTFNQAGLSSIVLGLGRAAARLSEWTRGGTKARRDRRGRLRRPGVCARARRHRCRSHAAGPAQLSPLHAAPISGSHGVVGSIRHRIPAAARVPEVPQRAVPPSDGDRRGPGRAHRSHTRRRRDRLRHARARDQRDKQLLRQRAARRAFDRHEDAPGSDETAQSRAFVS